MSREHVIQSFRDFVLDYGWYGDEHMDRGLFPNEGETDAEVQPGRSDGGNPVPFLDPAAAFRRRQPGPVRNSNVNRGLPQNGDQYRHFRDSASPCSSLMSYNDNASERNVKADQRTEPDHDWWDAAEKYRLESTTLYAPVPTNVEDIVCQTDFKIDGLMIVGETWNIGRIDGTFTFYNMFMVSVESKQYYKGLVEATNFKYRYEIKLGIIDNFTLSILFVSNSSQAIDKNGISNQVVFKDMARKLRDLIVLAMRSTGSQSYLDYMMRPDKKIQIHEWEWHKIGERLKALLDAEIRCNAPEYAEEADGDQPSSNMDSAFPTGSKFFFLLTKFGQNKAYIYHEEPDPYPHIVVAKSIRVTVHMAVDYINKNKIMFFNENFHTMLAMQHDGISYSKKFNVCFLPHCYNYVYDRIPNAPYNIVGMQQYTRIFHQVHRDKNDFFKNPFIARKLLLAYTSKLIGSYESEKISLLKTIKNGALQHLHNGIKESLLSPHPISSRTEFVWSVKSDERMQHCSLVDILDGVHCDVTDYITEFNPSPREEFICYDRKVFQYYVQKIADPIFNRLTKTANLVSEFVDLKTTENLYEFSLNPQDFADTYLAEALARRLLRGDIGKFVRIVEDAVVKPTSGFREFHDLQAVDWPFQKPLIWKDVNNGLLCSSFQIYQFFRDFGNITMGTTRAEKNSCNHKSTLQRSIMLDIVKDYQNWMKNPVNQQQRMEPLVQRMFQSLCYGLLQQVLAINKVGAENNAIVTTLWNFMDTNTFKNQYKNKPWDIKLTINFFDFLSESSVNREPKLAPLVFFGKLLQDKMKERIGGGTRRTVSIIMDQIIMDAGVPLVLPIESRRKCPIFLPTNYQIHRTDINKVIDIYVMAFKTVHRRNKGIRKIDAISFLKPFINESATISDPSDRPNNIQEIFNMINFLLTNKSKRPPNFSKQPLWLQEILWKPGHENCPFTPGPIQISPPTIDTDRRVTRSTTRAARYRDPLRPQPSNSTSSAVIASPTPPATPSGRGNSEQSTLSDQLRQLTPLKRTRKVVEWVRNISGHTRSILESISEEENNDRAEHPPQDNLRPQTASSSSLDIYSSLSGHLKNRSISLYSLQPNASGRSLTSRTSSQYLLKSDESLNSVFSRGLLFQDHNNQQQRLFDTRLNAFASSSSNPASISPENNPIPLRPLPYQPFTQEETRRIFQFLDAHNCLIYMRGYNIAKVMEQKKIVYRSHQAIAGHIKKKLNNLEQLEEILNDQGLLTRIREAIEEIAKKKYQNHLTKSDIYNKFGIVV